MLPASTSYTVAPRYHEAVMGVEPVGSSCGEWWRCDNVPTGCGRGHESQMRGDATRAADHDSGSGGRADVRGGWGVV